MDSDIPMYLQLPPYEPSISDHFRPFSCVSYRFVTKGLQCTTKLYTIRIQNVPTLAEMCSAMNVCLGFLQVWVTKV